MRQNRHSRTANLLVTLSTQSRDPNRETRKRGRGNGEGSIFPYRNGYAAYVWVTTPDGTRKRKWVYAKTASW